MNEAYLEGMRPIGLYIVSFPFLRHKTLVLLLDVSDFLLEVKKVSDDMKYLGEFPMLTENITFVLGRVTPVKYKNFVSNSFPNSVVRHYIVRFT